MSYERNSFGRADVVDRSASGPDRTRGIGTGLLPATSGRETGVCAVCDEPVEIRSVWIVHQKTRNVWSGKPHGHSARMKR